VHPSGDRQFEKEKRLGPDGAFEQSYVSVALTEILIDENLVQRHFCVMSPLYPVLNELQGGFGRGRGDAYRSEA
jgi:hypothetical protein